MTQHEGGALQFARGTIHHRFFRISVLGPQQQVVEHRRPAHVAASAEIDFRRSAALAVSIGERFEIGAYHDISRIGANLRIDKTFQIVPCPAAVVEVRRILRRDIRIIEYLFVGFPGHEPFGRTEHMALVATAAGRFTAVLNTGRNIRIATVSVRTIRSFHLVASVARSGHPDRTVVLGAEADRIIAGFLAADIEIRANMMRIVVVAVLHLHRQLGPAGTIDVFRGGDCSALSGESTLLAPILLAADRGVQMERIGGRGAQSGDGRTLISRRSRHRFRGVIRFTGGFVSKSYFDADRFFAFIGEAARQGGRRSGHIRRSDGTELRLGIFTRFKGRELRDGARITLVADNDIRIKIVFRFGFESVQLISQGRSRRSSLHLGIFLLRTGLIPEAGFRNIAVAFVLINAGKRRSGRRNPGRRRRFELRSSRLLALLQRGENDPFAGVILSVDYQIGIELVSRFRRQLLQTGRQRRVVRRNLYHSISRLGRCRRLVSETGFGNIGRITGV